VCWKIYVSSKLTSNLGWKTLPPARPVLDVLQIERERLEVDAEVDRFQLHAWAEADLDGGEVEDGADAGVDEGVVDLLGGGGGDGDDADLHGVHAHGPIDARQLGDILRATVPEHDPIMDAVDGNRRLLARVNEAFARQTPAAIETIRKSIERHDAESLFHAAHKLKGSVSNFPGVPALELAIQLERAAREGDFEHAQALAPLLENAMRDLTRRIESALAAG